MDWTALIAPAIALMGAATALIRIEIHIRQENKPK